MTVNQAVRQPLRARPHSRRSLDQRIAIRFPTLSALLVRSFARLSPASRIRRALLARTMRMSCEAYNRRDLDAVAIAFHPELEYLPYREFIEAGLVEPYYRGHAGYKSYIEATEDVWGQEVRLFPREVIDLGDRVVLLADMPMRAQASGISLAETYACVSTLRDGRVIRQEDYLTHAEALREVGLRE